MGKRRLVALLKELLSINWAAVSINISPLRGFSERLLKPAVNENFDVLLLQSSLLPCTNAQLL
jgi:hypothetical protein